MQKEANISSQAFCPHILLVGPFIPVIGTAWTKYLQERIVALRQGLWVSPGGRWFPAIARWWLGGGAGRFPGSASGRYPCVGACPALQALVPAGQERSQALGHPNWRICPFQAPPALCTQGQDWANSCCISPEITVLEQQKMRDQL